jgi:hypothetical protein
MKELSTDVYLGQPNNRPISSVRNALSNRDNDNDDDGCGNIRTSQIASPIVRRHIQHQKWKANNRLP